MMAMKSALIVSKERPSSLSASLFTWASSLKDTTSVSAEAIVFHNSSDTEHEVLGYLASIHKMDENKKFIYISESPSPLITTFFYGINGVVCDDLYPLSDTDMLLSIIEDYRESDFIIKQPEDLFNELRTAMSRVLSGAADEDELITLLSSRDWLKQVQQSMESVSTALVRASNASTELATYVQKTRDTYVNLRSEYAQVTDKLQQALELQNQAMNQAANATGGIIQYPPVTLPPNADKVLYIRELSHCPYLTSFLLAYLKYFQIRIAQNSVRLLFVLPKTHQNMLRYTNNSDFYLLHTPSIAHPTNKSVFITHEPRLDIMQYFFDSPTTKLFIVVDRFEAKDMLIRSASMKTMYAIGNLSLIKSEGISSNSKIICSIEGVEGSMCIPYIKGYSGKNTVQSRIAAYNVCTPLFNRINAMFGFN